MMQPSEIGAHLVAVIDPAVAGVFVYPGPLGQIVVVGILIKIHRRVVNAHAAQ